MVLGGFGLFHVLVLTNLTLFKTKSSHHSVFNSEGEVKLCLTYLNSN